MTDRRWWGVVVLTAVALMFYLITPDELPASAAGDVCSVQQTQLTSDGVATVHDAPAVAAAPVVAVAAPMPAATPAPPVVVPRAPDQVALQILRC